MTTSRPALGPDPTRTRLRTTMARIERAMDALPPAASADATEPPPFAELRTSWAELVAQLALGPEPALRTCPRCQQLGMRAATTCGYCWLRLEPLAGDAT